MKSKKRKKAAEHEFDLAVFVAAYIAAKVVTDNRAAFQLLPDDRPYLESKVNEYLGNCMTKAERQKLKVTSIKADYFDSSNYTHAALFINFTVRADYGLMKKLVQAHKLLRNDVFTTEDDLDLRRKFDRLTVGEEYLSGQLTEMNARLTHLNAVMKEALEGV